MTAALSARQVAAKRRTPGRARPVRQLVHQERADAPPLPIVQHRDRHLRRLRVVEPDVARHSGQLGAARADSDERLVIVVVDLGEVAQVRFGEPFD
jgi:hypothetical protein